MRQSILIVDDKNTNLIALDATISELDVDILFATTGLDALNILLKRDVSLVLMDVQMPGMDGFEVARFMRKRRKTLNTPIIFISAINHEKEYEFKGYEIGCVDFIFKPFNSFILLSKVRVILALDEQNKQLKLAFDELRTIKKNNEILLNSVGEGIIGVSLDGIITFVNPAAELILASDSESLIGYEIFDRIVVTALKAGNNQWERSKIYKACSMDKTYHSDVGVFRCSGRNVIPVEYTASPTHASSGQFDGAVIVFKDITERKKVEAKLNYMAQHDPLTTLGNRNLFSTALNNAIEFGKRSNSSFALLFMDLDRFKQVNDTLGHDAGDVLLKEVAHRIKLCIRESDILCRLGGDEFTIIVAGDLVEKASLRISEKLIHALSRPFSIVSQTIYIGVSIGIVYFPQMGCDAGELIKNADMAMYQAKREGRNCCVVFEPEFKSRIENAMSLELELRRSVEQMDFHIKYQPKFDIPSGDVIGAEALLRWSVNGSSISPDCFIPLAEETGMIQHIGRWVFETAVQQLHEWCGLFQLPNGFRISINMSVQQLQDPRLVKVLKRVLEDGCVSPKFLEIEITESLFMERTQITLNNLTQIRELGAGIALDDFGTGYSSMGYLAELPLTVLKIDKMFVDDIGSLHGKAIVSAVTTLSRGLGIDVIAEGVETKEQADQLVALGCYHAQGFYYSEPLSEAEMSRLLHQSFPTKANQLTHMEDQSA